MFTHAIDLACANSWLEYKNEAIVLEVEKKKNLDLLHFRAHIAEVLIKAHKTPSRKRGRPSTALLEEARTPTSSRTSSPSVETRPVKEVRLDGYNHMPIIDGKNCGSRCKKPGCKGKTHTLCNKCNVHLCLSKINNCFLDYHTKS